MRVSCALRRNDAETVSIVGRFVIVLILFVIACPQQRLQAQEVYVWFTQGVDTGYAQPSTNTAQQANPETKLIERINAAQASVDLAIYEFNYSSAIRDALIARHNSGVSIRIITDNDNIDSTILDDLTSTGITIIDDAFPFNYTGSRFMHNKFVIFDDRNTTQTAWIWTGSTNFTQDAFTSQANNIILAHNDSLATIYTTEFNEMWGSSGDVPSSTTSKFSTHKSDNTVHDFALTGSEVNDHQYFSPSDGVEQKIINAINTADYEIYLCLNLITSDPITNAIINRKTAVPSLVVQGVFDNWSKNTTGSDFPTLKEHFGGDNIRVSGPSNRIYIHHKYALIDAEHTTSDPIVITGSPNWSAAGTNYNDENILILRDSLVANQYLQEFKARFAEAPAGPTLTPTPTPTPSPTFTPTPTPSATPTPLAGIPNWAPY
jgi:phosphatidylserine/phosphatidylglycerophosphate/cardiolipin synthase-like enzyme